MQTNKQSRDESQPALQTFELRPGVRFPDWSVIASEVARRALTDINAAFGIEKVFAGYNRDEDQVRVSVLRFFANQGRAPSVGELSENLAMPADQISRYLARLDKKDLVVLDEATQRIVGAYPFTTRETEHVVEINGQQIHAMCAIDALGAGSMFDADIIIRSSCRSTGTPIKIELSSQGTVIESVEPGTAIVWSGVQMSNGRAADTLCTVLAFFSSDAALADWRAGEHPDTPGYRLTLEQGLQVGRAIFDPFLAGTAA